MPGPKNRYLERARISEQEFEEVLRLFCCDQTASQTASQTGLNRNTINRLATLFRQRMAELRASQASLADCGQRRENLLAALRTRLSGRSADNALIFGFFRQDGQVFTDLAPSGLKAELQAVIHGRLRPEVLFRPEAWRGYEGLMDLSHPEAFRPSGLDSPELEHFWRFCRERLGKFQGFKRESFILHLKECEFRYNYRQADLYRVLLEEFGRRPLSMKSERFFGN
ncbi:MAG: hypothetical protein BWY87_01357 [Deltaproteobacteria bacterium ADurb.Bin510]|nr:MAG: hypothetical protein BWY87_01357 [Deltaproteobacteria bacterium ADurb.Bin510]